MERRQDGKPEGLVRSRLHSKLSSPMAKVAERDALLAVFNRFLHGRR